MEIQAADSYIRIQADGKPSLPLMLREEPAYTEALAIAQLEADAGLEMDESIAGCSTEVGAVNEAVRQGEAMGDLKDAKPFPPVFGAEAYPPEILPTVSSPEGNGTEQSPRQRERARKQWWQFWK